MRDICMRSRGALAVLLTAALLVSLVLVMNVAPVAAAGTSVSVNPPAQSVNTPNSFQVLINVTSDQPILGVGCTVHWTPAPNIQCTNVARGSAFAGAIGVVGTANNATGEISNTGLAVLTPLAPGTHTFLVLTFTAAANGVVDVTLTDVIVNDAAGGEIPNVTVNAGKVYVGQPVPTADYIVLEKSETRIGTTENYTITYTIKNQGGLAATVITKSFIYIDGVKVAEIDCPALGVGATDTQTIGPFTLSAGADTIRVCADGPGLIAEGSETNNCLENQFPPAAGSVTVVPSAATVAVGQTFTAAVRISVAGSTMGAQSTLKWQLPERVFCNSEAVGPFYNAAERPYIPGVIDNVNGKVGLSAVVNVGECEVGSGDYLIYTFRALQAGVVLFDLSDVIVLDCNGNEIPGLTLNGARVVITATCSTTLAGNPVATIVIDCPEPKTDWALRIGRNIYTDVLNIRCNDVWRCDVADQDPATAGRMTEWDGMAYVAGGKKLDSKMQVRCVSEGTLVTLPTSSKIADGNPSGQSGNSGENFSIEFIQDIEFDDSVLHGGRVYQIVVTFTAYITA